MLLNQAGCRLKLLCFFGSRTGKADEPAGHLILLILRTEALEFESKESAGSGAEFAADCCSNTGRYKTAQRTSDHWERRLCDAFQNAAELSSNARLDELTDLLEYFSEELIEFSLVGDF